ncbi:hypothetical protein [Demequina sp. NBRC 110052]|uniref:hypothetical protein n=1 Tax=Demequina sp. NBRC 110052 TaxID=1570341 RepID=UPI000A07AD88|nr:hypothetical protein [Demequina sp. NBRC 110052]
MARGFNYAPGASDDVARAAQPDLSGADVLLLSRSRNSVVRSTIAERPDLPLSIVVALTSDSDVNVRAAIAANTHVAAGVLEELAGDRQVAVVSAVIDNPHTPLGALEHLTGHKKAEIRIRAKARVEQDASAPSPVGSSASPTQGVVPGQTFAARATDLFQG